MKPRLAESADELYRKVVKLTEDGVVHGGRILHPVVHAPCDPTWYRIHRDSIIAVECEGMGVRDVTAVEKVDLHNMLDADTAQVSLMSRWGNGKGSRIVHVLHSPSGNNWRK